MAGRRTIQVTKLVDMANHMLLNSKDELREQRLGMCCFIEQVLHETGRYDGFRYLRSHDMETSEQGKSLGIIFDPVDLNHQYPDDSRRQYSLKLSKRERGEIA